MSTTPEPRKQFDADRIVGHPFPKGLIVLLCQHGRRHQQRHLLAAHHRLEGASDRYLGLAEPDVPADQAVHGPRTFQVAFGFVDGPSLVRGFFVKEGSFELTLPRRVGWVRVAGLRLPSRLNTQQFTRQVFHGTFGLSLGLGPTRATEGVERRARFSGPHVLADQMGLADRYVELGGRLIRIGGGILDDQTLRVRCGCRAVFRTVRLAASPSCRKRLQAEITTDAMLQVDHVIALLQVGKVDLQCRTRRLGVRRFQAPGSRNAIAPKHLGVGDHHPPCVLADEPAAQGTQPGAEFGRRRPGGALRGRHRGWPAILMVRDLRFPHARSPGSRSSHPVVGPHLAEPLALAFIVAEDFHRQSLSQPAL
jgi:hypothetical protein